MAQRKSPSYPEWPVDRSVYSLFCAPHCLPSCLLMYIPHMCSPHISTLFNLNITLCDSFAQRFPSFAPPPPPPLPLYFDNFELIKLIIFSMSLFVLRCLTNRSVSSFCVLFSPLRLLKTGLDNLRRNKATRGQSYAVI